MTKDNYFEYQVGITYRQMVNPDGSPDGKPQMRTYFTRPVKGTKKTVKVQRELKTEIIEEVMD